MTGKKIISDIPFGKMLKKCSEKSYLRYLILIVIIAICPLLKGQDYLVGLKYGLGNMNYIRQSDNIKLKSGLDQKIGLVVEFSPFYSNLFFISGIEYEMSKYANILSIPLSIRLAFGKKFLPFIEGGGFYNSILESKTEDFVLKNHLGGKTGIGLMVAPNKSIRFDIGYFWRFGFTPGLEEEVLLPLDLIQHEEYKMHEGSLEFSIKYRF
jgi:hypothetical protein